MTIQLLLHVANEDPIVVDVEELPDPQDQFLLGTNPRYRDGKEVRNILPEVNTVLFPWWRIVFVEVLPSEQEEEVVGFIRD